MRMLLICTLLAVIASSCASQGYVAQKNPNKRGSSKGHRCGRTLGSYVNSIKR